MKTVLRGADIYNSEQKRFVRGDIVLCGAVIEDIIAAGACVDGGKITEYDASGCFISPGLVDVHTHGRAGGDFVSADADKLAAMSREYIRHGVTSVMPTLASATLTELENAADRIADGATGQCQSWIGIHLEGRYLNPNKRGAHAEHLLAAPDGDELAVLLEKMKRAGKIHVSAALELDEDGSFLATAIGMGATVGLAHTAATADEARVAFERGATSLTHTYNAMAPLHHRDAGALGVALTSPDVYCELIVDGFHVSREAVKLAYMLKKEKLVLITDSMEATGEKDGEYCIAGMPVIVKDGKAITVDGAIAGSTLDLIDGVKNLAGFADISFAEALYCATAAPAKMVGAYDKVGSLEKGKDADLIILDTDHNVRGVIFKGERIF